MSDPQYQLKNFSQIELSNRSKLREEGREYVETMQKNRSELAGYTIKGLNKQ